MGGPVRGVDDDAHAVAARGDHDDSVGIGERERRWWRLTSTLRRTWSSSFRSSGASLFGRWLTACVRAECASHAVPGARHIVVLDRTFDEVGESFFTNKAFELIVCRSSHEQHPEGALE